MRPLRSRDALLSAAIFVAAFSVFHLSPEHALGDSRYTLLVSEQLLRNQRFQLDEYFWPHAEAIDVTPRLADRSEHIEGRRGTTTRPRHVDELNGHVHYIYPHGTSVLAIPFVLAARAVGISTLDEAGRYDEAAEERVQRFAAAVLMAGACVLFFVTARLCLPTGPAVLVCLWGGLATQVWSTASRNLQSHTFVVLIFAAVGYLMLRAYEREEPTRPALLATLLAWSFFVRPTAVFLIVPLSLMMLLRHRRQVPVFAATGLGSLAIFFAYSLTVFGRWLPDYFQRGRGLGLDTWGVGLSAQLVSPSRGLLVYLPALALVAWGLLAYRERLRHRWLVATALATVVAQVLAMASYRNWWSGRAWGPRFHTDLVPIFVLLAILALRAAMDAPRRSRARRAIEATALIVFVLFGVFVHGVGATVRCPRWNYDPVPLNEDPMRVFDWSRPQWSCVLTGRDLGPDVRARDVLDSP